MKKGTFLCVMLFVVLLVVQIASADIYMKNKQTMDGFAMMGQNQPPKEVITETWISDAGIWTKMDDKGTIINEDGGMIFLDHTKKTYSEMNLNPEKMANSMSDKMDKDEMADFKKMMGKMMDFKMSVQQTDETKKINGYNCRKYLQTLEMGMGTTNTIIWATTDIKVNADAYARLTASMLANQPGMEKSIEQFTKEMKKIKGVQVLTETTMNMMGQEMKSIAELIEIKESNAPSNIYSVPKGYKKTALGRE